MKGYKVFNKDMTCRRFQYKKDAEFVYEDKLVPCESGFHFCPRLEDVFRYYAYEPENIVICKVEARGETVVHGDKVVTDRLYVGSELEIDSKEVQLAAVKHNGRNIEYVTDPSEELQLVAVKQNGYAIEYVADSSEKVKLAAMKQNGRAIMYVADPSEEVQLAAVKKDGYAIKYIKNPTKKVLEYIKRR